LRKGEDRMDKETLKVFLLGFDSCLDMILDLLDDEELEDSNDCENCKEETVIDITPEKIRKFIKILKEEE
jgi:hypothetical protein